MDLNGMKYAELQKVAKELGLKANMKADKLVKAIQLHYNQKRKDEERQQDNLDVCDDEPPESDTNDNHDKDCEEISKSVTFVNMHRRFPKRKLSDATLYQDLDITSPAKTVENIAKVEKLTNVRGVKRRNLLKSKVKAEPQSCDSEQQNKTERSKKTTKPDKMAYIQHKSKALLKPITPNFKKLHEAQFNKMESIDCYMQRKNKKLKTHNNSVKDLKISNRLYEGLISPVPPNKSTDEGLHRCAIPSATKDLSNKTTGKKEAPFKSFVLSPCRVNVRFSKAPHDNEYKNFLKTPARSSPLKCNAQEADSFVVKTSKSSIKRTPAPFIFTGKSNTSVTPGTQKKNFDLKTSLSRTLTYKPHKGKLKPFGEAKENPGTNKSLLSNPHQESYKQHKVHSRDERRVNQAEMRKNKKDNFLGARRGLVMM